MCIQGEHVALLSENSMIDVRTRQCGKYVSLSVLRSICRYRIASVKFKTKIAKKRLFLKTEKSLKYYFFLINLVKLNFEAYRSHLGRVTIVKNLVRAKFLSRDLNKNFSLIDKINAENAKIQPERTFVHVPRSRCRVYIKVLSGERQL